MEEKNLLLQNTKELQDKLTAYEMMQKEISWQQ